MKDKNMEEVGGIAGPSKGSNKGTDLTIEAKGVGVTNVEVLLYIHMSIAFHIILSQIHLNKNDVI